MRRRDEETTRDVEAIRINEWNVVWLSVSKSIVFRLVHFKYHCYRIRSFFFRNVTQRLVRVSDFNSSNCLYRNERKIVRDENVRYRSNHFIALYHLSTIANQQEAFSICDKVRYKLVKSGTEKKKKNSTLHHRSRTEFPFARNHEFVFFKGSILFLSKTSAR